MTYANGMGEEVNVLQGIKVRDAMTSEVEVIPENMRFQDILNHITQSKYSNFPVVDNKGKLTGILSFQDIRQHVFDPDLEHLVVARDLATLAVRPYPVCGPAGCDNLKDALAKLAYRSIEQLPVVDTRDPKKLVGILTRRDIITAYNKAIFRYEAAG